MLAELFELEETTVLKHLKAGTKPDDFTLQVPISPEIKMMIKVEALIGENVTPRQIKMQNETCRALVGALYG